MNRKRKSALSGGSVSKNIKQNDQDCNKEYTIERILDRRLRNGKTEYFLKWQGYSNAFNSWEPEENIVCPKNELNDFNRRFDERKNDEYPYSNQESDETSLSSSNSTNNFKPKSKHKSHKKPNSLSSPSSSSTHNTLNTSKSSLSSNISKSHTITRQQLNNDQTDDQSSESSSHDSSYIINEDNTVHRKSNKHINRLEMNYEVEQIYGATENSNGELMYLVKWKGFNGAELVNGMALEKRQPQVVLSFFRSNFKFK